MEVAGGLGIALLVLPVALTSLPLWLPLRRARVLAAVALGIFMLLTFTSVGLIYLPAWVAEVVAAERVQPGDLC